MRIDRFWDKHNNVLFISFSAQAYVFSNTNSPFSYTEINAVDFKDNWWTVWVASQVKFTGKHIYSSAL